MASFSVSHCSLLLFISYYHQVRIHGPGRGPGWGAESGWTGENVKAFRLGELDLWFHASPPHWSLSPLLTSCGAVQGGWFLCSCHVMGVSLSLWGQGKALTPYPLIPLHCRLIIHSHTHESHSLLELIRQQDRRPGVLSLQSTMPCVPWISVDLVVL